MNYYGTSHWAPSGTLSHHGIKGQKWGQRNGPPYPLGAGDHSAAEKRAASGGPSKSKKEKKPSSRSSGNGESVARKILNQNGNKALSGMDPVTAVYLTYITAVVAATAAYAIHQNHIWKKDKQEHMESDVGNIQKKIKGSHTADEDMAAINKGYADPDNLGAYMNCVLCSTAYDLRRRGYDIEARETKVGRRPKDVAEYYNVNEKDAVHKYKKYDKFVEALRNEPDGSRGITLTGAGPYDSNHAMSWEKNNGRVTIRDCQSNTFYDSVANSPVNKNSQITYHYIRTDNLDVNWDVVKDAVRERKD